MAIIKPADILSLNDEDSLDSKESFDVSNLAGYIRSKFVDSENARQFDEQRWLRSYRNYRGIYGNEMAFTETEKSKVFVKITKTKVLAAYGQLIEVLFSQGKFPIGIHPTEVPEGAEKYAHLDPEEKMEEPLEDTVEAPADARSQALDYLSFQCQALSEHLQQIKTGYDDTYAIPFFTSYSEGERPLLFPIPMDLLQGINVEPLADLLAAEGVEEVLEKEILDSLRNILSKISETERVHQEFAERCEIEILADQNISLFYATEAIEVKEKFSGMITAM